MIQEALRLIAEFKDNASEGLEKLRANLTDVGQSASNLGESAAAGLRKLGSTLAGLKDEAQVLKPLEQSKVPQKLKEIDQEARKTANGGLEDLKSTLEGIDIKGALAGGDISGAIQGFGESVASSLIAPLTAAATALGATVAGVFALKKGVDAVSNTFKEGTGSYIEFKKALDEGKSITAITAASRANRQEVLEAGRAYLRFADSLGIVGKARREGYNQARNAVAAEKLFLDSANKGRVVFDQLMRAVKGRGLPGATIGVFNGLTTSIARMLPALTLAVAKFAALGGAAIVAGINALAFAVRAAAVETDNLARKLGVTTEKVEALRLVASETGTTIDTLQNSYDRLAEVLVQAQSGTGEAAEGFAALGLSAKELIGLPVEDAAAKIIQRYKDLGRTTEGNAALQAILGDSFRENIDAFEKVAGGAQEATDRIRNYGAVASATLVQEGRDQQTALNNLGLAFKGLGFQLAELAGPALTNAIQNFADFINSVRQSGIAAKFVNFVFASLKLLLIDFGTLLGGVGAALVALFTGDFKGAATIAKLAIQDAADAWANFGKRSQEAGDASLAAANAAEEAAKKEAAARKAAAQAEVERAKRAAAAKKAADEQNKLFEDAKQGYLQQLGLIGANTEAEKLQFEIESGRYKNLSNSQKAALVDLAQEIDQKNRLLSIEEKRKSLQDSIDQQATEISLGEEELKFASLTSDEREKQIFLLRELNRLRTEGKDLSEEELQDLMEQTKVVAERRRALTEAQRDATTISNLIDNSYAETEKRVQRSIGLARKLLEERKISEVDYVRFVREQIGQLTAFNEEAAAETTEFWREAARGIQQSLSTFFFDFMQGKLTDLAGSFKRVIDQMVANALAARLAQALFGADFEKGGALGGWVGQAASFLGGIFGGARAMGGPVEAGKAYLVGEKGPELVRFGASGQVIPNDALQSMGTNVSFTITAMDSQDVLRAMSKIKREAAGMFNNAGARYNLAGV